MRHVAHLVVGALAITASNAYALDHLMHINEVLLSNNGSNAIQYIELADPAGEPFPSPPYLLELYNASGNPIANGTVTLPVPSGTTRLYVATASADTAFGTTRAATLPVALPANGQACFTRSGVKIHCVAWGCVNPALVGAERAPSPPDGQSAQRQTLGGWQLGTPTPDANNQAGTMAAACPTDPDAPPVVDGPSSDGPSGAELGDVPDGGMGGGGNNGDGGGCCQVEGSTGAIGFCVLALGVLLSLRASRRKR